MFFESISGSLMTVIKAVLGGGGKSRGTVWEWEGLAFQSAFDYFFLNIVNHIRKYPKTPY